MNSVEQTELLFILLLVFVIGFGSLARRVKMPYPIVLVLAGLLLSFIPRLPRFHLNTDLVFLAVLPPLLFSAAFETSWRDFKHNFVSIFLLAFGLVGFTVAGVAFIAHFLLPGFDWRLGTVLGAVVAPTDAIAATAIAKRLHLPHRIIDLLEGESLVNDASGLLALEFTTAWIVTGQTPALEEGLVRLFVLIAGGLAFGLIVGWLVNLFKKNIDDAPIEITLSLVVPYIAYIGAETAHGSGVLAAVAAGLYLGKQNSYYTSSAVRIESRGFWNTFTFVLNGLVFLLIGLQLQYILGEIRNISRGELLIDAAEFVAAVILLRLIWIFPGSYAAYLIRSRLLKQTEPKPSARGVLLVGWTGMRGVISLAAAIALPEVLADGSPFPQRNVIIFLTFCIIFTTLVLQGLTLPLVIRRLGLMQKPGRLPAEAGARRKLVEAAVGHLEKMRDKTEDGLGGLYDDFLTLYRRRLAVLSEEDEEAVEEVSTPNTRARFRQVSREVRRVERATALELRKSGEISDELFRVLEHELDLLDLHFSTL